MDISVDKTVSQLGSQAAKGSAGIYNDLSGLQDIRRLGRKDSPEAMKAVAKQFESVFVGMMLKSMRDANQVFEDGNVGHGNESQTYRDMYDKQMALSLSQGKGIGLAEVLTRQFQMQNKKTTDIDGGVDRPVQANQQNIQLLNRQRSEGFSLYGAVARNGNSQIGSVVGDVAAIQQMRDAITVDVQEVDAGLAADEHGEWASSVQLLSSASDVSPSVFSDIDKPVGSEKFKSPQEFIDTLFPVFQKYAEPLGLDPRALLSQAALETGWGKHMIRCSDGSNGCNLFGIKAGSSWEGATARVSTTEFVNGTPVKDVATFRAYDNYADSVKDYVRMMAFNPRYRSAIIKGGNAAGYFGELQKAGYATDPHYAKKMLSIYHHPLLVQSAVVQSTGDTANRMAASGATSRSAGRAGV